jgi:hypothetical protein
MSDCAVTPKNISCPKLFLFLNNYLSNLGSHSNDIDSLGIEPIRRQIDFDQSAIMASVPADIVHEFIFKSPRPSQGYDHDANVEPVSRVLSVLSLLDKGDWTITHTKARGTITFTLSWNGIRAGVLKDLEVTQVIKCTGQCYLKTGSSFNGYLFNLNHKASSTSRVDYLVKEGKVSLNLDHSGTTDQMHTGYESTATYTCTVSFARLSKVPQVMDQDSHAAKSAKIYLSEFALLYG